MIEYRPWSKNVLEECIADSKNGKIPAIDLELTAKCSGACCIYCDSKPDVCDAGMSYELDFQQLKKLILGAKKRGLKWIYTCGLGEPLEDPKFWELIELLKENDIQLSMFSNGIFIKDLDIARKLKECNVNIVLKMDTFDEKKFDTILGKNGAAKKIYEARDLLIKAGYGADKNGLTNLAFSIVPTKLSVDGIPEVVSFCKEHGIFASIGELEQAGEVIKKNLEPELGLSEEEIIKLKDVADEYCGGSYMRPICPCIMTGVHIDNLGNCLVDRDSGLNCKWFLLKDPSVEKIGNIKEKNIEELHKSVQEYREKAFVDRKDKIHQSCNVSYVFGGCGGNPKDIIELVEKELMK